MSRTILEPQQVFIASQQDPDPRKGTSRQRFLQHQMVGKAVPDQRLGYIVEAGEIDGSVRHLNHIQVVEQQHSIFRAGLHSQGQ